MQNENKITIEECQKLLEQNPFGSLLQMKITEAEQGRIKSRTAIQERVYEYLWRFAWWSIIFGSGYHMRNCGRNLWILCDYCGRTDPLFKSGACNRICYMHRQSGKTRKKHYSSSI